MPKIIIREQDNTLNRTQIEDNFTVAVPGFWYQDPNDEDEEAKYPFDDYDICKLESTEEFIEKIGFVPAFEWTPSGESTEAISIKKHYGNQIAYELLKLGYKVLYVNIGGVIPVTDPETGVVNVTLNSDTMQKYKRFVASTDSTLFKALLDKATYNFRFILTGSLSRDVLTVANELILNVANISNEKNEEGPVGGRGDCIALLDIPEEATTAIGTMGYATPEFKINSIRDATTDISGLSKYAAWFCPAVDLKGLSKLDNFAHNTILPASFYYLACLAKAREKNFAEWYAIAGLNRGTSEYSVNSTTVVLGETAINALQPRKPVEYSSVKFERTTTYETSVNVVAKLYGNYYLWGNRTAAKLDANDLVASHFLNIRELCCTLKKNIYEVCKKLTFDPNSDLLWINFCNAVRPILELMKADQGINDYDFIKLESKRAELKALVRIVPIEAVEDFDITVSLEDSLESMTVSED